MTETDLRISIVTEPDMLEVSDLLEKTITAAFVYEGIAESNAVELRHEISGKIDELKRFLREQPAGEHWLAAQSGDKIVGVIASGEPTEIIQRHLPDLGDTPEIKNAYVHPDYQSHGVGTRLFMAMLRRLRDYQVAQFVLDTGYSAAQKYWTRRLGPPEMSLQDYWGPGFPHVIWRCLVTEAIDRATS